MAYACPFAPTLYEEKQEKLLPLFSRGLFCAILYKLQAMQETQGFS